MCVRAQDVCVHVHVYVCVCECTLTSIFFYRPFVETRAAHHNLILADEVGFSPDSQNEYKCRPCIHMDAFR